MAASRTHSTMGGGKKKSKKKGKGKKAHKMTIRRSANGGYIAEHSYQPEGPEQMAPEPEEHTVPDIEALKEHVGEHMAPEEQQEQAPAPSPSPAAGM